MNRHAKPHITMKINDHSVSRRNFLGALALTGASFPFSHKIPAGITRKKEEKITIHVFSKHLQEFNYEVTAETAAEIGFDGVDLAMRPGGHVLPEKVEEDLPRAVEIIKKNNLLALLMTTAIIDADDVTNRKVLQTAARLGIKYYRTNWLAYPENPDIPKEIENMKQKLKRLASFNEQNQLYGSYQNHSGAKYVGAPVWDIAYLLHEVQSQHLGNQYDIRHATVEGGLSWPLGLQLIHPYINTLVIKDFKWGKEKGKWTVVNTPIGEGMVDFKSYFAQVKSLGLTLPISMHFEYDMLAGEKANDEKSMRKVIMKKMKADLSALKDYLKEAELITS